MSEKNSEYKEYHKKFTKEERGESRKERGQEILESGQETELPILKYAKEIKETIANNQTAIIVGETGSGKTTQIPLLLLEKISPETKIAITQPRRVAARSVAHYVAEKVGCQIGEEVGYQVRFEDRTTEGTRINFMTDGILLRKIQEDPLLKEYSVVMVDEAHERSLNIDFTLGLLKRIQKNRIEAGMNPIKIIVASATLEKEKFARYFGESPVVEVPGRLYPVDIHYEKEHPYDYIKAAVEKVKTIINQGKQGDILIFMPGQEEIDKTIKEIEALELSDVVTLPLYGQMAPEDQNRIFEKMPKRKVIVATNIAETSITVPGIRYVIDSGFIKQIEFDPKTGIETLAIRPHAKSGCIQRAGRAGRLAPGECWRLYTEDDFNNRPEFQVPEIQRSNLAHVILMMKQIGIEDVKSFEFIDPPPTEALNQALETLKTLGALDDNERITEIGELMAELPLEPHISRMVVEAEKYKCVEDVCTIASFLGTNRPVFVRPRGKEYETDKAHKRFKVKGSDFLTFLKVWQEYEANHYDPIWARNNFLNPKVLEEVRKIRYQLFRVLRRNGVYASKLQDPEIIGKSIAAGRIENLMEYYSHHSYRRVKDNEKEFFIHPSSSAFGYDPRFIVSAEVVKTTKKYVRIVQEVKSNWIPEIAPQFIIEKPNEIYYDSGEGKVMQEVSIYLKGSDISCMRKKREITGEEAVRVFAKALAQEKINMPFVQHNKKIRKVIHDLWLRSGGEIMDFTTEDLEEFYIKRLDSIASENELNVALEEGRIDLELKLNEIISPEQMEEILSKNPDKINIAGKDREIRYDYWKNEFSASVKIPAAEILKIKEVPRLPSGRDLTFKVVSKEGETYAQFSGTNIEELKQKSRQFLIDKQWEKWYYSEEAPKPKQLENFDPLGNLPKLPEPVKFGVDPETNEPLFAYPAVTVDGNKYVIEYFPSREEAEKAQARVLEIMNRVREEQRKKEERERLLTPTRELLEKIKKDFDAIRDDYEDYVLPYDEENEISNMLWKAEKKLESDTKEAFEILKQLEERLSRIFDYKEQRRLAKERVNAAINEYYSTCPLCGQEMKNGECTNFNHDTKIIDFEIDEEGYEVGPAVLSQIVTDQGKIVAQLRVSHGGRRYSRGDVHVVRSSDIEENAWQGEPFKSLKLEDLGKILTSDQVKERKARLEKLRKERELAEAIRQYKRDLKYAEERVKEGDWGQGRFRKGRHPKTGEEQWELTVKKGDKTTKYIVGRWSRQPTSEDMVYFYSEDKTLVNTPNFQLILVRLEEPFPEEEPKAL